MKKLLICAALISLLIPLKVNAQQKSHGCLDNGSILLDRKDSSTVVCYQYTQGNNKPQEVNITYSLLKWNEKNDVDYAVCSMYIGTQTAIWIIEKYESTLFYLKGRKFDYWYKNPNAALVTRHKNEITMLLNDMEKAKKLQNVPSIKNF